MFHRSSRQILLSSLVTLLAALPAYAVKNFKISNFAGAHQIWFEAEDYDERNPDNESYFRVVDRAGASGKAVTRVNAAGGMMRWTFDISVAGGKGGTWYFWGRILNPANASDYMLVKGDPGDPTIPTGPPFPGGGGTAPFVDTDDRIFEIDVGPSWGWAQAWDPEGHVKDLQNGLNTMYIFHRQGNDTVFWDVFLWTDSASYVPTDDDYRKAMVLLPGTASNPVPTAGATDVPRDAALSWTAGDFAGKHDVYFGTDMPAVTAATATADPAGVYKGRQDADTYDVAPLAFGQTYYWRIDEVNKTPDGNVFKGTVWSFTVEPYGYPVRPVAATASSAQANMGPEKTIDGSGMTGDLHGIDGTTMWLSAGTPPNWIQYEFDRAYKLHELQVWNSNGEIESFIGFGAKTVTIETSIDGTTWTPVANVPVFNQAPGTPGYAANTTVNLDDVEARFVKLTIGGSWGGVSPVTGLSEVRFSYAPMQARGPQPADNAGAVSISATLDWRPGRDATSHTVFFGTDPAAVAAGTAAPKTVTEHGFDPGTLNFGTFYYWKVDEIGTATYPGNIWTFATQPYLPVEDFESYTDQEGEEIYSTWIDGWTNNTGSVVGYLTASGGTFAETRIVHGGKQSMPFEYNNIKTPFYSEAEREFSPVADWTGHGADTLSLWVRGNPAAYVEEASVVTMSAGGHDVWDNADDFRFAYKALNGNGSITAKVESLVNTNAWAKAGVMIRETLDAGSKHAFFAVTPGNSCSAQRREVASGASASTDWSGTAVTAPYWVRVTRTGNAFKYESSPDGKTWTALGADVTVTMAANVYIGIAVTSHDASLTTIATVSNVSTTGTVTGAWQAVAIGDDPQPANSPGDFYVTVQDSAGKTATATNPTLVTSAAWTQWTIPLSSFAGVNMAKVKKLSLGVGDRASPKAGGAGMLYVDDIQFGKPIRWVAAPGEILVEAESATSVTAPMAISDDPLASGGKYIGTPTTQADSSSNPPTTGIAQIPFTVPGGKYKLVFRVAIPGTDNSVWVRIADGTTQTNNHASGWVRFNEIAAGDPWHWAEVYSSDDSDQVVQWTLAPGAHTLEIAYREAGARVDVIVIQPLN